MAKPLPLPIWDRSSGTLFQEWMEDSKTTYESRPRLSIKQWIEPQPLYDWFYALLQHTPSSAKKIEPFIRRHHINMDEFEPVEYRSYAEFFVRRFRPGMRKFPSAPHGMGAFAEARYMGWNHLDPGQQFPVKGHSLKAEHILGNMKRAESFLGGPVLLVRLAPVDYHRMHYFDDGKTIEQDRLGRRLWTVNWRALLNKPDILFQNERLIQILETRNFGKVAFVEIGAMTVGRIIQIHPIDIPFHRGEEKSVFQYGGSAIVVFGEAGKWRPAADIVEQTRKGIETYVRLGEPVASAI